MKARTLIIAAVAMFAIAAPAAQANLERILPTNAHFATHHKIVAKHHRVSKSTSPRYIYFPGPSNQASSVLSQDDCVLGDNCTVEQICAIWGMNCDTVASTPAPVAASAELPAVDNAASNNSSVQSDQAASSVDNIYTDNSETFEDC